MSYTIPTEKPDLANATPEFLLDELGQTREVKKASEGHEAFLKTALLARLEDGETAIEGELFDGTISEGGSTRLNAGLLEDFMATVTEMTINGEEVEPKTFAQQFYKFSPSTTIRAKRKE